MVPLVLLAVAWQLVLTGHTLWLCANAARAAARADLVGESPILPDVDDKKLAEFASDFAKVLGPDVSRRAIDEGRSGSQPA